MPFIPTVIDKKVFAKNIVTMKSKSKKELLIIQGDNGKKC